jgi:hypothetical protein
VAKAASLGAKEGSKKRGGRKPSAASSAETRKKKTSASSSSLNEEAARGRMISPVKVSKKWEFAEANFSREGYGTFKFGEQLKKADPCLKKLKHLADQHKASFSVFLISLALEHPSMIMFGLELVGPVNVSHSYLCIFLIRNALPLTGFVFLNGSSMLRRRRIFCVR